MGKGGVHCEVNLESYCWPKEWEKVKWVCKMYVLFSLLFVSLFYFVEWKKSQRVKKKNIRNTSYHEFNWRKGRTKKTFSRLQTFYSMGFKPEKLWQPTGNKRDGPWKGHPVTFRYLRFPVINVGKRTPGNNSYHHCRDYLTNCWKKMCSSLRL